MDSNNMLVSKTRNAGFVDRRTYERIESSENRLASVMARRAGLGTSAAALKKVVEASIGIQTKEGSPGDAFSVDELDASQVGPEAGFDSLVSPMTREEFFGWQYRNRRPLLFRGQPGRFGSLMQWADLGVLIRNHNLRFPQLQLVVDGESVPEADYMRNHFGLGTKHSDFLMNRRLDEHNLVRYLRNGATLIINSVSSVHEPLSKFFSIIEGDLGVNTSVNLYASWKDTRGFATHWDSHDVYIVQVQGSKVWSLHGETRTSPMAVDVEANLGPPPAASWKGTLTSGDVLYIPRGWWHDALVPKESDGEGSMHLTVSFQEFTGRNIMDWLGSKLAVSHQLFRVNVPLCASREVVGEYFDTLREIMAQALEEDFSQDFIEDMRAAWSEDVELHLERRIEPWNGSDWNEHRIRLRGREQAKLIVDPNERVFVLVANGFTLQFDMSCRELIIQLMQRRQLSVNEMKEYDPKRFPSSFVDQLLIRLAKENVVHTWLGTQESGAADN